VEVALRALALLALAAAPAGACAWPGPAEGVMRVESGGRVVLYRAVPAPIRVNAPFEIEAMACASEPVTGLKVDAHMPDHRHGMNYRPTVSPLGEGRYRARGLVFHMPGRWEILFDVETARGAERVRHAVVLP
jgi:hypothetical protein